MTPRKKLFSSLTIFAAFAFVFMIATAASAQTHSSTQLQVNLSGSGSLKGAPAANVQNDNGHDTDPAFAGEDDDSGASDGVHLNPSIAKK